MKIYKPKIEINDPSKKSYIEIDGLSYPVDVKIAKNYERMLESLIDIERWALKPTGSYHTVDTLHNWYYKDSDAIEQVQRTLMQVCKDTRIKNQ